VSQPLNNIVQIVLENASEPFNVTEVVTVQRELLVLQILNLAISKSPFPVRVNYHKRYLYSLSCERKSSRFFPDKR